MKTYLVGGAVRDRLLGLNATDNDWVIVGATPTELKHLGYKAILASFPVFLHPTTNEEYALARTERKVAKGYHGFVVDFDNTITLEQDLKRRDLTINSIAIDENGYIIDPFNGQEDLHNRILRHTSISFKEDPLRVIRLARFMAQLYDFNFSIADETKLLVKEILISGELDCLTKERLNIEFKKAINCPAVFFKTLQSLGCLEIVFPHIFANLNKIPPQTFFATNIYKAATVEEKIALTFYAIDTNSINPIKKELNLSNNHGKLTNAISQIYRLINHTHSAKEILHTLRKINLLRDKTLSKKTCDIYKKLANILDDNEALRKLAIIETIISSIQTTDIKTALKQTQNLSVSETIDKLYIDTINKLLKI